MIRKEVEPTFAMYFKAGREIFRSTLVGRLFYVILLLIAVNALVFDLLGKGEFTAVDVVTGLVPLALVFVLFPMFHYRAALKSWKTNPLAPAKRICEFTQSGLRNYGEGFNVEFTWDKITRIKVSKRFIFFYVVKSVACCAPRELFSSNEVAQIHEWQALTSRSTGRAKTARR